MDDDVRAAPLPPAPVTDDEDTGGYWQAAAEGRLVVRTCVSCGGVLHLPKPYCHHCGSWDTSWREARSTGTLYSWTVVHHQIHAAFPTPYTVVLVELDDPPGVRLIGHLESTPELHEGMAMQVRFHEVVPGATIPDWEVAP